MLNLHVNYECLYDEIHKEEGNTKKMKNPPKIILDEEIEEKIN